jgi:hypothetical protein
MSCPFCTFKNDNIEQTCQLCGNFIKSQCINCTSLNDIDNDKCYNCKLYIDDTKNKICKQCDCKNIEDNKYCYNCDLSFTCICNKCKFLRKELNKSQLINNIIQPFIKYGDEKKLDYKKEIIFNMFNINTMETLIDNNIFFLLYNNIINYILDKDKRKEIVEKKYNNMFTNDELMFYYQQIILPVLRNHLIEQNIDISSYETKMTEYISLHDEVKTKPVENNIINKLNNINIIENKEHNCFCANEDDIKVLNLPCCKNMVHMDCIKKWFTINHICPFCKQKNCNL